LTPKTLKTQYGQILGENDPNPNNEREKEAFIDAKKYPKLSKCYTSEVNSCS
jgi:hypothetical protein